MRITYLTFRNAPKLSFNDWNKYLNEISTSKKLDVNTVKVTCLSCNFRFFNKENSLQTKLVDCGNPGFTGETVSEFS